MMILTNADHSTLDRALELEKEFKAGIFPRGASQHRHFKKLADRGLLVFEDYGVDVDGDVEGEVPIYKLTEAGRTIANILGEIAERESRRAVAEWNSRTLAERKED